LIIADDESPVRMDLREMLTGLGYLVVGEATDGQSAVNLARQLKPDLVIMDIVMPGLDGIEAARILDQEKIAPVVLLTAYSDKHLIERASDAGVLGYIAKPFREANVRPVIEIALARAAEQRALEKKVGELEDSLEARKLVERAKGILMDTEGLKEAEAFRRIQKMSMDTRRSMKHIAQAIILAHETKSLGKKSTGQ